MPSCIVEYFKKYPLSFYVFSRSLLHCASDIPSALMLKFSSVWVLYECFLHCWVFVHSIYQYFTAQKIKFFIKDFFSKCDQIRSFHLKKSLMENFIFCAVFMRFSFRRFSAPPVFWVPRTFVNLFMNLKEHRRSKQFYASALAQGNPQCSTRQTCIGDHAGVSAAKIIRQAWSSYSTCCLNC